MEPDWQGSTLAPSENHAELVKGTRGTVIEAFEKIWLSTIAESGWQSPGVPVSLKSDRFQEFQMNSTWLITW
jgi:hypothetical protein